MTRPMPLVRTSEVRDYLRCQWRWWHAWREGLKPKGTESAALWLGTGVHLALANWYCGPGIKRGPHPAETFAQWASDEIEFIKTEARHKDDKGTYVIEEKLVPGKELGIAMLEGYINKYGQDEHMSIIRPEQTFQVQVMDRLRPKHPLGLYAGTYDLVWRDLRNDREIWLEEHKTAKAIFTGHLELDPQAGTYWSIAYRQLEAAGLIQRGDRFTGIEYNFLRKALPEDRPINADGFATNKPQKAHYIAAIQALGVTAIAGGKTGSVLVEKATLAELELAARFAEIQVFGEVSVNQPKPLFERLEVHRSIRQRARQIERIQDIMQSMNRMRSGKHPILKNPTRDCSWDCSFYQLCVLDETAAPEDVAEFKEGTYDVRDPYADHRKSAD